MVEFLMAEGLLTEATRKRAPSYIMPLRISMGSEFLEWQENICKSSPPHIEMNATGYQFMWPMFSGEVLAYLLEDVNMKCPIIMNSCKSLSLFQSLPAPKFNDVAISQMLEIKCKDVFMNNFTEL
jgi:hypothetical protein